MRNPSLSSEIALAKIWFWSWANNFYFQTNVCLPILEHESSDWEKIVKVIFCINLLINISLKSDTHRQKKCFHKCLITTAGSWLNKLLAVLYLKEIGNWSLAKLGNHVKACFQQVEWLYRHYPPNSHRCLGNTSHNLHGN